MVGILRPKPDARTVIQPETAPFGLFLRDLQPLALPDPLDPFDVHHPACTVQHRCDAAITVAAILDGERDDVGRQSHVIIRCRRNLALCGAVLTENTACPSFGNAKLSDNMIHAGTATRGA